MDKSPSVCAGYFKEDLLFDIGGLVGEINPVPDYVALTFALLTRGIPTHPTRNLENLLGFEWNNLKSESFYRVPLEFPDWSSTIKGAGHDQNPALDFFSRLLPQALGEWGFICKLLVPEYPLFSALAEAGSKSSKANDELVDFFLPQANLVIEIDGGQHQDTLQKDFNRDRFLNDFGITTIRINTKDLASDNDNFAKAIDQIISRCSKSRSLAEYKDLALHGTADLHPITNELTAIIRLQIAVIFAIAHKQLSLSNKQWTVKIVTDFSAYPNRNWIDAAFDELFNWFELFAKLKSNQFSRPTINSQKEGLTFDISIFSRADNGVEYLPSISVRTCPVQFLPTKEKVPRLLLGVSYLSQIKRKGPITLPKVSDLAELNRRLFGHDTFLPGQEQLILNAISGNNSLGLMPTGGGKSLCFELKASLNVGTTIVVVPIKALGRDHEAELAAAGFAGRAVNIDSDTPPFKRKVFDERISNGEMRFVFVSPERFQSPDFRKVLVKLHGSHNLQMFVIDEVHCMSEWGHDFRPAYLMLPGVMRELAPNVPIMGLTATASVNVLRDIQSEFSIPEELVAYEMHRSRYELYFSILKGRSGPSEIRDEVISFIADSESEAPPPIHIFCRYVNGVSGVENIARVICNDKNNNLRVGIFSGEAPKNFSIDDPIKWLNQPITCVIEDYDKHYKPYVQSLWKAGKLDVIVTTKAFGMGVNKSNVRRTLHAGMPSSMEAFYQEAGRAGRDRHNANCDMLFTPEPDDAQKLFESLEKDNSPENMEAVTSSVSRSARGDFRAQIWFLNQSNISVEREACLVKRLHEHIEAAKSGTVDINFNQLGLEESQQKFLRPHFQHALFRLYQMGIIGPWTVLDWGRKGGQVESVRVQFNNQSFQQACSSVAVRMQAISGKGSASEYIKAVQELSKSNTNWDKLYTVLLNWVRQTQLLGRLRSTWNLYEQCRDFSPNRADEFRDKLEAFFRVDSNAFELASMRDLKISESTEVLQNLILMPDGQSLKEKAVLLRLAAQLSRLLEGTRDSPGLNLADGILRAVTMDTDSAIARRSLLLALPNGLLDYWRIEGRNLFTVISKNNEYARDNLGRWLLEEEPEREELLAYYSETKSIPVGLKLLDKLSCELENVI